ncbi:MAG: hypothetical protein ABSE96_18025 [Terracidiphilus sp.]|jgi:hypothetical protein
MNRQTTTAQSTLYQMLSKKGCKLTHHSFFVSARDKDSFEHAIENSQRTRSFLFLTLAAITANRLGRREIVVIAENGQMAIHLPLSSARIAAFSTHTAHPDVLAEMQLYLRGAFGIDFVIQNPYGRFVDYREGMGRRNVPCSSHSRARSSASSLPA